MSFLLYRERLERERLQQENMLRMSVNSVNIYILGGFISPHGSAAYLKETVQSENEITVIMNVDYTTRTETLSASIKNDHEELCLLNGPTHVVTSVTYGM